MHILLAILLILSNLTNQSTKQKMEKFDFKTYEKYKENPEDLSSEYIKKDGTKVFMSEDYDEFYVKETPKEPYLFKQIRTYYKTNNNLKESYTVYKKNEFWVGKSYVYSENGELISEIDNDKGYSYSLEEVLNFCKQNKIEIKNIDRNDSTESDVYVWKIKGKGQFNNEEGSYEMILDGATGELLTVNKARIAIYGKYHGILYDDVVYQKESEKQNKMNSTLIDSTSSDNKWTPLID